MLKRTGSIAALAMLGAGLTVGSAYAAVSKAKGDSDAARCSALQKFVVDSDTTITQATLMPAQFVTPPSDMGMSMPGRAVSKSFCRVEVTAKPDQSEINYEVWLPLASDWNGRFFGVGTGGFGGGVLYNAPPTFAQGGLAGAVEKGYAAMATDYGHKSPGMNLMWAVHKPAQLADFGFRAVHASTVGAKKITAAFYGKQPNYAYWDGCSRGGAMGMVNAQRWYTDYNGIIAGDPARDWIRNLVSSSAYALRQVRDPASRLPESKRAMLHKAVLDQCDAVDGLTDGLIQSARQCKFDPSKLLCKGAESDSCLTKGQVEAVKELYTGIVGRHGQQIADPYLPGSESMWMFYGTDEFKPDMKTPLASVAQFWSGFVYEDPTFDPGKSLNIEEGQAFAKKKLGWILSYEDPDLSPFQRAGGKLLTYHGEADGLNSPVVSTAYYKDVVGTLGQAKTDEFIRYYLVPGMGHCFGGDGPDVFNMLPTLQDWVEKGEEPKPIVAAKVKDGNVVRTRPLCPYPQVAKYQGSGDINDAANFTCRKSD